MTRRAPPAGRKRTGHVWLVLCDERIAEAARSRNGALGWIDILRRDQRRWRAVRVPVAWLTEPPKRAKP